MDTKEEEYDPPAHNKWRITIIPIMPLKKATTAITKKGLVLVETVNKLIMQAPRQTINLEIRRTATLVNLCRFTTNQKHNNNNNNHHYHYHDTTIAFRSLRGYYEAVV